MTAPESVIIHVTIAAEAVAGKLGTNVAAFDVGQRLTITNVFLIISARNEHQVGAAVDAVEKQPIKQAQLKPMYREGNRENRWVPLDYIDLVVHVQCTEECSLYNLERLRKDCLQIPPSVHEVPVSQDDKEQ